MQEKSGPMAPEQEFMRLDSLPNDQFVMPKQIVLDKRLSFESRSVLMVAVYFRQCMMSSVSKNDILEMLPGLSEYRYRKAMRELRSLGYVVMGQIELEGGGFSRMGFDFRIPKMPSEKSSLEEYLAKLDGGKTQGRERCVKIKHRDCENGENQQNPTSRAVCDFLTPLDGKSQNPTSEAVCDFRTSPPDSPYNKLTPPSIGKYPSIDEGVSVNDDECTSIQKKDTETKGKVGSFTGGRSEVKSRARDGMEHVLENCSEEDVGRIFDIVQMQCKPKYREDQYNMSRPIVDMLMEGSDEYRSNFETVVREMCMDSRNSSTWVSCWLGEDFGQNARNEAIRRTEAMASGSVFS